MGLHNHHYTIVNQQKQANPMEIVKKALISDQTALTLHQLLNIYRLNLFSEVIISCFSKVESSP